ncbi:MAG: hypothetical protein D6706_16985 [Chloroflexi bacterium]|nr:MAG: hypothetical protein D6706_16985 [Chloroflexota bacterium]
MKRINLIRFFVGASIWFVLAGCQNNPEIPPATATQTAVLAIETTPNKTPTTSPTTPPLTATPKPTATPIPPYAGAPVCPPEQHNDHAWHSLWNSEYGCHYTHEHHANPHDLDDIFGTQYYTWAGGEISYPWQTFSGAGANFEQPAPDACLENDCKHAGYKWLIVRDANCDADSTFVTNGANNCITDARVQMHGIFAQPGALTRFHSVWIEARVCQFGGKVCGIYRGGGHLDLGRLNIPRGIYVPLPGDPPEFAASPPEKQPYRIHGAPGDRVLDSWQSEGNQFNLIPGVPRLMVGYGVHVRDGWGGVDPANESQIDLACPDFQCERNASEAALFRVWVTIPRELDGSQWDSDARAGFFSFTGFTNRYGDIVTGCTEPGLDCVPVEAIGVPIGRSRYRSSLASNIDYDISPFWPDGTRDWWIEYPN